MIYKANVQRMFMLVVLYSVQYKYIVGESCCLCVCVKVQLSVTQFSVEDFFFRTRIPINLPIESLMAFAATALMGGICLHLCLYVSVCGVCLHVHFVCVCQHCVCVPVGALWFTAPLNPIQSKARAAMESEQRVDMR